MGGQPRVTQCLLGTSTATWRHQLSPGTHTAQSLDTSQTQFSSLCISIKPRSTQPTPPLTNHKGRGFEVGIKGTTALAILQEDIAGLILCQSEACYVLWGSR